jgi:hypothetical protein
MDYCFCLGELSWKLEFVVKIRDNVQRGARRCRIAVYLSWC